MSELVPAASWSGAGEGEQLWFLGTLATIKVSGEATDGRFALIEFLFPHHASPPFHTHPQDESYIVLEGRLTVQAGDKRFQLEAGAAAVVAGAVLLAARGKETEPGLAGAAAVGGPSSARVADRG